MKLLKTFLLPIILFAACKNPETAKKTADTIQNKDSVARVDSFYIDESEVNSDEYTEYTPPDTTVTIRFDEFTVSISRMVVYEHKDSIASMKGDTIYLLIELGETLEGQQVDFNGVKLENLRVEQAYQTSMAVGSDGEHCDLLEWKHFTSEWKPMKDKNNNTYSALSYTESDREKFPKVSPAELKESVRKYCEGNWFEQLGPKHTPWEDPCYVNISRYFIRISGIISQTGQKITKLIVFEVPMGC